MKEFPVDKLKVQTYFTEPVYLDKGYILLGADVPTTTDLIGRLNSWGYRNVLTEGEPSQSANELVSDTSTGEIAQNLEDEQRKSKADSYFKTVIDFLEGAFTIYKAKEELKISDFADTVKAMIGEIKANRHFMLNLEKSKVTASSYVITHSAKTAILALAIADYLKLPSFKQIDVGTAALLHQIGLLKIPESVYLSEKPLSPPEKKVLAAHPILGFRILKAAAFSAVVCQAVLEHNERLDGTGFPRRLSGDKISLYARIIGVASSYNAATSKRPYKSALDGHSGIMDLIKSAGRRYDEKVIAALLYVLSLYPIGTHIVMSNGAFGTVVQSNQEDPKHPVVKLLVDENGTRYANPPVVHTREGDEVVILRAMNSEDLARLKSLL
ncbi:MAG: HD-GYP domain-containing protein [Spirochaetales bacterium]|nr:HD-GYP domain-containing protein [Spirochaetales bacterium]